MPPRSRSPGQGRTKAKRLLAEEPGAAVPPRSRSHGQGRARAKRSPIAEQGQLPSRHPFPRPRPGDLNSGTESALKLLQNRKFVILEQNLRVFSYGLGDARSEPGMTGRRFRVKPGMTLRTPGMTRSFALLRMTWSGTSGTFPARSAGSGSAPAKPFTRTGSGGSEAEPDSEAGAAAVPAPPTMRQGWEQQVLCKTS